MPAIARNDRHSCLSIVFFLGLATSAAAGNEVRPVLLALSTALEAGNAAGFLDQIDKQRCPQYATLESNVVALLAQYEVGSSIGILEQTAAGEAYELKLDWLLQVRPAGGEGPADTRRQDVRCRIERSGKRWKVTALEPVSFFSAIRK